MKVISRRLVINMLLGLTLAITSSGCSRVIGSANYELRRGETVSGNLFVGSGDVALDQGSRVTGSVLMLCCDLIVRGEVDGDVVMLAGNILIDPQATIRGTVTDFSGDQGPTSSLDRA